jgi:hypothetical protein
VAERTTDPVGLVGVALAAAVAVVLTPGKYEGDDAVIGGVLALILAGYYRPEWPEKAMSAALQAVAFGSVLALALALPAMTWIQDSKFWGALGENTRFVVTWALLAAASSIWHMARWRLTLRKSLRQADRPQGQP